MRLRSHACAVVWVASIAAAWIAATVGTASAQQGSNNTVARCVGVVHQPYDGGASRIDVGVRLPSPPPPAVTMTVDGNSKSVPVASDGTAVGSFGISRYGQHSFSVSNDGKTLMAGTVNVTADEHRCDRDVLLAQGGITTEPPPTARPVGPVTPQDTPTQQVKVPAATAGDGQFVPSATSAPEKSSVVSPWLGIASLLTILVGLYLLLSGGAVEIQDTKGTDEKKPAGLRCCWAILIGVGFRRADDKEGIPDEKSPEAEAIKTDIEERIARPIIENWEFSPRRVKTLVNQNCKKKAINTAFNDVLGDLEAAGNCTSIYILIHVQGHHASRTPSQANAKDLLFPAPDTKVHDGIRTWDAPPDAVGQKLTAGVLYDYELAMWVTKLRDAVEAKKAEAKKKGVKIGNSQVIVQADMCYSKQMLQSLIAKNGITTVWVSDNEKQGYEPVRGSTFAQGFHKAFADEQGGVDASKKVTVDDAVASACKGVEEFVKNVKGTTPVHDNVQTLDPHPGHDGPSVPNLNPKE